MDRLRRLLRPALLTVLVIAVLLGNETASARGIRMAAAPGNLSGRCPDWHVVPSPSPNQYDILFGVAAVSPTAAWAVGQAGDAGLIEHWNGQRWQLVPNPYPTRPAVLDAVSARAANDVWVVGGSSSTFYEQTLTLHWDGTRWQRVPAPREGTRGDILTGVAALAANDVWAVGYTGAGDVDRALEWPPVAGGAQPQPQSGR
jgi:hypothetical protein